MGSPRSIVDVGHFSVFGGSHDGLYGAQDASFHLDGFQSQVFVCYGLGVGVPFGDFGGAWGVYLVGWYLVVLGCSSRVPFLNYRSFWKNWAEWENVY
jgi:hypothetical protein